MSRNHSIRNVWRTLQNRLLDDALRALRGRVLRRPPKPLKQMVSVKNTQKSCHKNIEF